MPPLIPRTVSNNERYAQDIGLEVILRDASVTSRDVILISSGVLCITTHHQGCVCQMRRPINLSRSCEGGYRVGSRLRTIRSLLGGLCSTIQGFQHSDALFRDSAPPPLRHDFPPLLRRCCAYLKPSLLGSCRAATAPSMKSKASTASFTVATGTTGAI